VPIGPAAQTIVFISMAQTGITSFFLSSAAADDNVKQ